MCVAADTHSALLSAIRLSPICRNKRLIPVVADVNPHPTATNLRQCRARSFLFLNEKIDEAYR